MANELAPRAPTTVQSSTNEEQRQYLTFLLGQENFGVSILRIKEIIECGKLTTVPMMPDFIRGVINLRGSVVPVIDLASRFWQRATPLNKRTCIIIIEAGDADEAQDVGIMVDAVNEVLEIAPSDIEPAPAFGAKVRTDFISGMGKIGEAFVILLDVNRVLSMDDLATLAQMGSADSKPAPV